MEGYAALFRLVLSGLVVQNLTGTDFKSTPRKIPHILTGKNALIDTNCQTKYRENFAAIAIIKSTILKKVMSSNEFKLNKY